LLTVVEQDKKLEQRYHWSEIIGHVGGLCLPWVGVELTCISVIWR